MNCNVARLAALGLGLALASCGGGVEETATEEAVETDYATEGLAYPDDDIFYDEPGNEQEPEHGDHAEAPPEEPVDPATANLQAPMQGTGTPPAATVQTGAAPLHVPPPVQWNPYLGKTGLAPPMFHVTPVRTTRPPPPVVRPR